MQTAKNVFLWPRRDWLRKGFEAYFTPLIELAWSKRRILEIYLNVVEWGPGIYGAQAAAEHYFRKPASRLTVAEAARSPPCCRTRSTAPRAVPTATSSTAPPLSYVRCRTCRHRSPCRAVKARRPDESRLQFWRSGLGGKRSVGRSDLSLTCSIKKTLPREKYSYQPPG